MQIVIDIPDRIHYGIELGIAVIDGSQVSQILMDAVKLGVRLPKGHGRLIDESKITKCEQIGLVIKDDKVARCLMTNAPTIIEADKEGEE